MVNEVENVESQVGIFDEINKCDNNHVVLTSTVRVSFLQDDRKVDLKNHFFLYNHEFQE